MIGEWIIKGIELGIRGAAAIITAFVIIMTFLGFIGIGAKLREWGSGNEETNENDDHIKPA